MITSNEAKEIALDANLEQMTQAHLDQYDRITDQIKIQSEEGKFNTFFSGGLFPDVSSRLQAQGYDVQKVNEGYRVSWLR